MLTQSQEQRFLRSRSVVSRVVAGETLIVPVRGKVGDLASIYSFNGTGSLIWRLLDAPTTLPDLIHAVERTYEVAQESARKDVAKFLSDMLAAGLVEPCPGAATGDTETIVMEMTATEANGQAALDAAASH